ncbi:hypothetical protein PYCCODRAFT_713125 [Trametes coccinea BRFM310]|uniref:Uncharacterized protein n=1 Tax=Trametes coccinea (strain BRFM310) TaxID=1353009 RepID=A0A1Y2II32_TRAC3|nr:hypothetical protein PYCCODRAFT_713125 [Trametes coccinea BRFM310]
MAVQASSAQSSPMKALYQFIDCVYPVSSVHSFASRAQLWEKLNDLRTRHQRPLINIVGNDRAPIFLRWRRRKALAPRIVLTTTTHDGYAFSADLTAEGFRTLVNWMQSELFDTPTFLSTMTPRLSLKHHCPCVIQACVAKPQRLRWLLEPLTVPIVTRSHRSSVGVARCLSVFALNTCSGLSQRRREKSLPPAYETSRFRFPAIHTIWLGNIERKASSLRALLGSLIEQDVISQRKAERR